MMPGIFKGTATPGQPTPFQNFAITAAPMFSAMAAGYASGRGPYAYMDQGLAAMEKRQKDKRDAEAAAAASAAFKALMRPGGNGVARGGYSPSGTWSPAPPPPSPVDVATQGMDVARSGGLSFGDRQKAESGMIGGGQEKLGFGSAVMSPQEMLIAGAEARGLNPIDVATAISYETGGRFDPMIAGPTTQWGTHRGLIQFGEPQAKQHGVDFSNPDAAWRSQLDPTSGAVWKYLDGAGVRPGMGLPEVYSAINAGSVGRMNASDANNGGAPGTVADKVAGMGPHREKAAQFLGGTWTPNDNVTMSAKDGGGFVPGYAGGPVDPMADPYVQQLMTVMSMPGLSPEQQAVAQTMLQSRIQLITTPQPGAEEEQERARRARDAELLGLVPGTPEFNMYVVAEQLPTPANPLDEVKLRQAELDYQQDLQGKGTDPASYGTTLQFYTGKDGKLRAGVLGNDGSFKEIEPPGGGDWAQGVEKVDAGTKWVFYDKRTGEKVGEEPKDLRTAEAEKALGQAEGEAAGEAVTGLGNALAKGEQALALIDQIATDPALPSILGIVQGSIPAGTPVLGGGQSGADLNAKIEQLQGQVFLEAFESLKGAGQITEIEGQKAERAKARLQRTQSPEAYKAALAELREVIEGGIARAKSKASMAGGAPSGGDLGLTEDDLKYLGQP